MGTKLQPNTFSGGDIQMNTCLSTVYLTLSKIDSRIVRMAFLTLIAVAAGGFIQVLPIAGDVGG